MFISLASPSNLTRAITSCKAEGGFTWKWEKERRGNLSLSKTGRCHGFSEVYESSCWGQSLPLLKESLLSLGAAGSSWRQGPGRGFWVPGARSSCISTARAVVQAGSRSGPHTQLCFLGWVNKMVTPSICVVSPLRGLAVWISLSPLEDREAEGVSCGNRWGEKRREELGRKG